MNAISEILSSAHQQDPSLNEAANLELEEELRVLMEEQEQEQNKEGEKPAPSHSTGGPAAAPAVRPSAPTAAVSAVKSDDTQVRQTNKEKAPVAM